MKANGIVWKTIKSLTQQVWAPVDAQDPPDYRPYFVMRDGVPDPCCDKHPFYPRDEPFP
jgi:hypothetical protein